MNQYDNLLEKFGLKYEDLQADEKEWLIKKSAALAEGQLTVEKVRDAVRAMRIQCEQELTSRKDAPTNFVSLLTFLIPIIGLIRKWYQDQREVELKARLRNYMSLEVLLTSHDRQKREIDQALSNIASGIG